MYIVLYEGGDWILGVQDGGSAIQTLSEKDVGEVNWEKQENTWTYHMLMVLDFI